MEREGAGDGERDRAVGRGASRDEADVEELVADDAVADCRREHDEAEERDVPGRAHPDQVFDEHEPDDREEARRSRRGARRRRGRSKGLRGCASARRRRSRGTRGTAPSRSRRRRRPRGRGEPEPRLEQDADAEEERRRPGERAEPGAAHHPRRLERVDAEEVERARPDERQVEPHEQRRGRRRGHRDHELGGHDRAEYEQRPRLSPLATQRPDEEPDPEVHEPDARDQEREEPLEGERVRRPAGAGRARPRRSHRRASRGGSGSGGPRAASRARSASTRRRAYPVDGEQAVAGADTRARRLGRDRVDDQRGPRPRSS